MDKARLYDLILVTGHAILKDIESHHSENDGAWLLQKFQRGEPRFYIEHLRFAALKMADNPEALLVFSGGKTRRSIFRSEAESYFIVAKQHNWWTRNQNLRKDIESRAGLEEFARDSFENLLFGICRFQQITGRYPRNVSIVSWAFKRLRFDMHRLAIRFPENRYRFYGINNPVDTSEAMIGERKTTRLFLENFYGAAGELGRKRIGRNPFGEQHDYRRCPGLGRFFDFIENPENRGNYYSHKLPWEG